jgi:DNA-binding GntR family transcriptional regulator
MSKSSSTLSQPAYDYLLDLIMTKQLMPGEKIPENKIAELFGISRTPVRDAMRQLANEGLIVIFPNRFAQVAEFNIEAIREIGVLRISLDTLAIKLALLFGSQSDFLNLRKLAAACDEALQSNDFIKRTKLDTDFHMELAQISHNSLLIKFQKELNLRVQFIILHYSKSVNNEQQHINQHVQLADALLAHDEQLALALIVDHLTSFYNLGDIYPADFFNSPAISN